jgi:hypothetical protein
MPGEVDDLYSWLVRARGQSSRRGGIRFASGDPAQAQADLAVFAEECDLARQAVAQASLGDEFTGGRGRTLSLRWVYTHMIEEYAQHNGHADLLRQRIDGATGS